MKHSERGLSVRVGVLISGGKDSMYALYQMSRRKDIEIACLLVAMPERDDSYMFHHPNVELTKLQAKAMGIPIMSRPTSGIKEEELEDLKELIGSVEVDALVTGALASEYQRKRVNLVCEGMGRACISPLWHRDPAELWREELSLGFQIMITSVSAEGLDDSWLGKVIDEDGFHELRKLSKEYRFHLGFEGGEAETFVLDMPLFEKRIVVSDAEKEWNGSTGVYRIKKARLAEKG